MKVLDVTDSVRVCLVLNHIALFAEWFMTHIAMVVLHFTDAMLDCHVSGERVLAGIRFRADFTRKRWRSALTMEQRLVPR